MNVFNVLNNLKESYDFKLASFFGELGKPFFDSPLMEVSSDVESRSSFFGNVNPFLCEINTSDGKSELMSNRECERTIKTPKIKESFSFQFFNLVKSPPETGMTSLTVVQSFSGIGSKLWCS